MTAPKPLAELLGSLLLCSACGCATSPAAAPAARAGEAAVVTSTQGDPSQVVTRIIYVDGMT